MKDSNTSRSSRRCDLMFYFATIGRLLFLVRAWRWHALDNIGRIVIFDRMPDCIFASFPAILCFSVFPMADTPISCKTRTHLVHFWLDQPVNKSKMHFLFEKKNSLFSHTKNTHKILFNRNNCNFFDCKWNDKIYAYTNQKNHLPLLLNVLFEIIR